MAKIAFISTMCGFPWGGSEYLWACSAERALREGHEVIISIYDWSLEHPIIKKMQTQGAKVLPRSRFSSYNLKSKIVRILNQHIPIFKSFSSKSAYEKINDFNPDVICVSQGALKDGEYSPDLLEFLYSCSSHYIVICQLNVETFLFNDCSRRILQEQFLRAASVAFVSTHNLKLAERQLAIKLPNAKVVQNPVNLSNRSALPFPTQSRVMLASVARLETSYKGQDVIFEVLSAPEWKERNWQFNLYGSGPDRLYLESLAEYYGISERINFLGHIDDIRSIWDSNHLLVLASRGEGTPLSLVEAMLCGRPSVVTDVGGNAEWIEDSVTGFIAEAPTVKSLSTALARAWLAKDTWDKMGVSAHDYAISKLDPDPGKSLLDYILEHSK